MVAIGLEWCFFANIPPVLLMSGTSRIIIEIFKVEKIGKKGKGYPNGKFALKRLAGSSSHRVKGFLGNYSIVIGDARCQILQKGCWRIWWRRVPPWMRNLTGSSR